MSAIEEYRERIRAHGVTKRGAALQREIRQIDRHLRDNLSYQTVTLYDQAHGYNITSPEMQEHAILQEVAIINSDNLNEKYIYSFPGDDVELGALIHWMDNYWLVAERDANTTVYTRAKLIQCNYLLRWVTDEDEICEQWCVIEDGTKLKRVTCTRNSLAYWKRCVKTTPLIAGTPLEPNDRNGAANSRRRYGLKIVGIGQSAAKLRTEEGSTTIPAAGIRTSVLKRGALNRHRRHGEDIVCALVKAGGVRFAHRRGVATLIV